MSKQTRAAYPPADGVGDAREVSRFRNSWATLPLRLFLAAVFLFASYAKLTYPGFFDPSSSIGFHSAVQSAKSAGTPLSGLMGPLASHTSLFGHLTAFGELAIGLGLLVGLLTRIAAVGGMVLTGMIVLSINWLSVKEYTGNGGWFTSVDLAVIAALSVFLIGGAGPLSVDWAVGALRARRRARQEAAEPPFRNHAEELEDSRRRLRGDAQPASWPAGGGDQPTSQLPDPGGRGADQTEHYGSSQDDLGGDDDNSLWGDSGRQTWTDRGADREQRWNDGGASGESGYGSAGEREPFQQPRDEYPR